MDELFIIIFHHIMCLGKIERTQISVGKKKKQSEPMRKVRISGIFLLEIYDKKQQMLLRISYLIKQKYLILRIYTIKISSKQILMNQNRRFTRSSGQRLKNIQRRQSRSKEQAQMMSKIDEVMASKNYNHALSIINSLQPRNHWTECKRAHILFQMGKTPRSLNAVRNALKIQRRNCCRCFSVLLQIIQKSRPQLRPFVNDIENSLKCENLPKRIKIQFQILKSEINQSAEQSSVTQQKFQKLTEYYEHKGLLFKKIEIVQIQDDYRVARAKSLIKPNQVIIFVPQTQMITLELAKSESIVRKIAVEQQRLKSPKHCMLSVFLLIHLEKRQASPYYNYIQCLPKKLNNFPIYYPDDLLEQLSGTYFLTIIKRKKSDIEEDYEQIISIVPELKNTITYQKFTWARMVVCSRIFGVIINQVKTDALVPIADMLNHKIPKMTSWYFSDDKKGFIVQNGSEQIPEGQQIFDSYGSKCNSRFLLNYGFIIPQNSFNEVVIKVKRMRNTKTIVPSVKLTTIINSDQFRNLMTYYRKAICDLNSKVFPQHEQQQSKSLSFISLQNQYQVWQLIYETMKDQMKEYKTTIRADQKILRSLEPLPYNYRNCVEIRLGQKIVLDFYIRMSKKMIDFFSKKRSRIDVAEYEAYIREIAPTLRPSSL